MSQREMVTYDVLLELESEDLLSIAFKKGIIPTTMKWDKEIYELYLKFRETNSKMDAYMDTSIELGVSTKKVIRVVKRMES